MVLPAAEATWWLLAMVGALLGAHTIMVAVRIVNGWNTRNGIIGPIENFSLAYHDGTTWKPIAGARYSTSIRAS